MGTMHEYQLAMCTGPAALCYSPVLNSSLSLYLPSTNADLYQVLGRHVGDVRGVKVRGGVHPLVQVFFLDVSVAVHMDYTDILGSHRRNPA